MFSRQGDDSFEDPERAGELRKPNGHSARVRPFEANPQQQVRHHRRARGKVRKELRRQETSRRSALENVRKEDRIGRNFGQF